MSTITNNAVMTDLRPYAVITIDGVPTDVPQWDTSHGVDQPVATGSITLPLPLPAHLAGGQPGNVINRKIEIQAGYRESVLRPVIGGYLDADHMRLDRSGNYATIKLIGYGSLLTWKESRDLVFPGNILLEEVIRSLCARRGMPKYRIDNIYTRGGDRVRMGGNPNVNGGDVIVPKTMTPEAWINRMLGLFGYRAFDTAQEFRVQRVSGTPTLGPMGTFREGLLAHRLERARDRSSMVTAWTVEGASYTDDDGIEIPIISIPEGTVPFAPLLDPPGYREDSVRDGDIVTQVNANAVRQIHEIDYAAPGINWSINARGNSLFRPGATVRISSTNMEAAAQDVWLMSVRQSMDEGQGYKATLSPCAGGCANGITQKTCNLFARLFQKGTNHDQQTNGPECHRDGR